MKVILSWLLWPLLAGASCVITAVMLRAGLHGEYVVAIVFLFLAGALGILERIFPHEPDWNDPRGQVPHDVFFVALGSGVPGAIANASVVALLVGVAQWLAHRAGGSLWPTHWPVVAQIALTVVVGDFGAYWGHRLFHTVPWMWPFHSVHHVVPRLWWLNSGRVHPVDAFVMIVFSMPLLVLLGIPDDMVTWLGTFTTYVGMLSHTNVEMRCGALDWIFNTPGVHRWHHSRLRGESDNNYGENTMIWDVVFGTHYRQALRRPPADIGTETPLPPGILGQVVEPFRLSYGVITTDSPASSSVFPDDGRG